MKNGDVVISLKGHDKGNFYVLMEIQNDIALLCDGKRKLLSKPKKKNIRHLKESGISIDFSMHSPLYDAHIRKALKCVNKDICLKN